MIQLDIFKCNFTTASPLVSIALKDFADLLSVGFRLSVNQQAQKRSVIFIFIPRNIFWILAVCQLIHYIAKADIIFLMCKS